jgi:DNA repair protein RecN (Recombination protein N)
MEEMESRISKAETSFVKKAERLSELRKKASLKLQKQIEENCHDLMLPHAKFVVDFQQASYSKHGVDDLVFYIIMNPGEMPRPLARVTSGGELSRLMLGLKVIFTRLQGIDTVIFDEIDTGVSGSTSQKIGIKLAKISKSMQTICVTHSAQIASLCDSHFLIKKKEENGRAVTSVTLLDNQSRIDEIARIIGGIDLTEKQYGAAKDLLLQREELLREID